MYDEWDNDFHTRVMISFLKDIEELALFIASEKSDDEIINRVDLLSDCDIHNHATH